MAQPTVDPARVGTLKTLNKLLAKHTGLRILRRRPLGLELRADVKRALPGYDISVVFDVGANVGQSALAYAEDWPSARILSFEPASALFSALVAHTSHLSQVEPHQLAFGVQAGEVTFVVDRVLSHIQRAGEDISEKATETVKVDTLTGFCDANGIQKIDFLKIDTEGFDLDVLKGAAALLDHDRIGIVQVEAGLSPLNTTHVPLEQLKTYLETKGYYLFGIYEQVHEWSGEPVARRCNPAFVSSALWKTLKWR